MTNPQDLQTAGGASQFAIDQPEPPTVRSLIRGLLGRTAGIRDEVNAVAASVLGEYPPDPAEKACELQSNVSLLDDISQLSSKVEDIARAVHALAKDVGVE